MAAKNYVNLDVPPAGKRDGGVEILRAGIVGDGPAQGLALSLMRAFEEPRAWGMLLGGIAQDIANLYARETKISADDALAAIRDAFAQEVKSSASKSEVEVVPPGGRG
jgi:hypothetical protein